MVFNSNTTGNTPVVTERMRIATNGNVGIGTTSPATTLDVVANGTSQGIRLNISGVGRYKCTLTEIETTLKDFLKRTPI